MPETGELPANEEIDEALRAYRQIYHQEEHRNRLRALREIAVRAMRELARFNPYLTGSVLNGNAGRYADINLQLFTENEKAVELYLIDRDIPYRAAQTRLYLAEEVRTVPVYTLSDDGTDIELTVLSMLDLRAPLRTRPDGKSIERAKLPTVEQLLAET
jgi:predicted nucleotidyltransferase